MVGGGVEGQHEDGHGHADLFGGHRHTSGSQQPQHADREPAQTVCHHDRHEAPRQCQVTVPRGPEGPAAVVSVVAVVGEGPQGHIAGRSP